MGEKCYAFGSCGNDEEGKIAVSSLKNAGVDVSNILIENKKTNIMNIIIPSSKLNDNSVIHSWYSPIDITYTMDFSNNLPKKFPDKLQENEVYIILDKFLPINLEFLKTIKNKKVCLDVGHIRFFEHFTRQYITEFFKFADYIELNDNVLPLLLERLDVKDELEIFKLFGLDLLVITKGKKGAIFVYKDKDEIKSVFKSPELIVDAVDTSGAGDAFFSTIIKEYAYAEKIDSAFIDKAFKLANASSRNILMQLGSRK